MFVISEAYNLFSKWKGLILKLKKDLFKKGFFKFEKASIVEKVVSFSSILSQVLKIRLPKLVCKVSLSSLYQN